MSKVHLRKQIDSLTCMHSMRYNVGIMNNTHLQITIRGLDPATKDALIKKANHQGVSLNRYALKTLQNSVGTDESEKRYQTMKNLLNANHINEEDRKAIDDALAWSDKASLEKQRREEREAGI